MFSRFLILLKERLLVQALAGFAAGCLMALAMAPANVWAVMFLSLSVLYVLLHFSRGVKAGFVIGWVFGFGYFLCGLSWIGNALLVEGNDYQWAWPFAVSGIPFGLAIFWGIAAAFSRWFGRFKHLSGYGVFVLAFLIAELGRSYLFTGFPWNLLGYSWADHLTIVQSVSLISIFGLTGLSLLWAVTPVYMILARGNWNSVAVFLIAGGTFLGVFAYGSIRLGEVAHYSLPAVNVKLVPGHVAQEDKWKRDKLAENFSNYVLKSLPSSDDDLNSSTLIVWPETATIDWQYGVPELRAQLLGLMDSYGGNASLLAGVLRINGDEYFNSLAAFDGRGDVLGTYDKSHLVPFGEYIPFQKYIPLPTVSGFSGFVRGQGPEIFTLPSGLTYAAAICYEIIFPYSLLPAGELKPDFIVNVTNDAWYDGSAGPYQHYTQVLFRAVEYGVPIIRVANKGESAVIDPYGFAHSFVAVE